MRLCVPPHRSAIVVNTATWPLRVLRDPVVAAHLTVPRLNYIHDREYPPVDNDSSSTNLLMLVRPLGPSRPHAFHDRDRHQI
jgi:hypothetical protein